MMTCRALNPVSCGLTLRISRGRRVFLQSRDDGRWNRRVEILGDLEVPGDDAVLRQGTISHQYWCQILEWRAFSGVHAKMPVPAGTSPDQRPLRVGFVVAELEPRDTPGIGEPDDQVETVVGEPATARLTHRPAGRHFVQHAISYSSPAHGRGEWPPGKQSHLPPRLALSPFLAAAASKPGKCFLNVRSRLHSVWPFVASARTNARLAIALSRMASRLPNQKPPR